MKDEIKKNVLSLDYLPWMLFCRSNKLPRRIIYEALTELMNDKKISESDFNNIDGIISGLEGSCMAACVDKYYGDPNDQREIVNFARSRLWLTQDYYSSLLDPPLL